MAAIENTLDKKAKKEFLDIQLGDVPATYADRNLCKTLPFAQL